MWHELAVAVVAVADAAVKVVKALGMDTSFSALPEAVPALTIVSRTEMVTDWGDKAGWQENTGSVDGLGKSHTVVPARTGEEGHWTDVRLYHCGPQGGSPPCARALLKGYTENPTMGASFLADWHWASWSEATREAPSMMMGLHAAGTVNVDS